MYNFPQVRKNLSRIAYLLKTGKERLFEVWERKTVWPAAPVVFTLSMSVNMEEKGADALWDLSPFI